mgnify:CR=1 FL=1
MRIEDSPVRRTIDELLPNGPETWHLYDTLVTRVRGMEIVEKRDPRTDSDRCADYVFGRIMQEPWAQINLQFIEELWSDTIRFLEGKGYYEVEMPKKGVMVAYFNTDYSAVLEGARLGQAIAKHFGVFQNNRVISKWSRGHVYRHPIESVPTLYGDEARFFRKSA